MTSSTPLLTLALSLSLVSCAFSHGIMIIPNQRGTLTREDFNSIAPEINPDAETDFRSHFPAGDKDGTPGAGKASQERAAGPAGWIPFQPISSTYKWHSGVCGDLIGNPDHMRGGKYYNGGQIVATYKQGSKISIKINMIAHHNGFNEFHICDVGRCDGEISEKCFRDGHCKQLQRSRNPICDSGNSKACSPIDPNYPGRWYYPCSKFGLNAGQEVYGLDNTMLYDLPENFVSQHAVLHWYWATANGCNPPGVIDYFDSPHAPKTWGQCPGSGGARGGVAREQKSCGRQDDGEMKTPEEYLQCADVRVEASSGRSGSRAAPVEPETPTMTPVVTPVAVGDAVPTVTPAPSMEGSAEQSNTGAGSGDASGLISGLALYADGNVVGSISDGAEIDVSGYQGFTIQAMTTRVVSKVQFFINGNHVKDENHEPYFLNGNSGTSVSYWKDPILNEEFTVAAKAEDSMLTLRIKLIK